MTNVKKIKGFFAVDKYTSDWNVKISLAREKDFAIRRKRGYTVHNYK